MRSRRHAAAPGRSVPPQAALLLWQVLAEPQAGQSEARVFRADVPEPVRALIWRAALPAHAEAIADAETLALALDDAVVRGAGKRPVIPERTPPALQAARAGGVESPPWGDEAHAMEGGWAGATERRSALKPEEPGMTPTEVGVPRLRLPSRTAAGGGARSAEPVPRWPHTSSAAASKGWTQTPRSTAGQVNMALVIAIGVALFILFFLIGYVAQPIRLP